jgi:peptidoglycan/LPS O-acetylase OafA/YrhL
MLAVRLKSTAFGAALTGNAWASALICGATLLLMLLPSTDLPVALLIPPLVFSLTAQRSVLGRLLTTAPAAFLGRVSYSVYLIHFLFLGVLEWLNRQAAAHHVPAPHTAAAAVTILLTLAVAEASTRLIDVPGRRWMRALFEGAPRLGLLAEPSAP